MSLLDEIPRVPDTLDVGVPCAYRVPTEDSDCEGQSTLVTVTPGGEWRDTYVGTYTCCGASYGAITHPDLGLSLKPTSKVLPGRYRRAALATGDTCTRCGEPATDVDHIVTRRTCTRLGLPGSLMHHPLNLQVLCSNCNTNVKKITDDTPHPLWEQWASEWLNRNIPTRHIMGVTA